MWVVFQQRVVNYLISTDCLVHTQGVWYFISQKSSTEHQEKKGEDSPFSFWKKQQKLPLNLVWKQKFQGEYEENDLSGD